MFFYRHPDCNCLSIYCNLFRFCREAGIASAEAKAVAHRDPEAVKIAISHIQAFPIHFLLNIPVVMAEAFSVGIIPISVRPGVRQLSAGGFLSAENICHCIAALHTRLRNNQQSLDVFKFIHEGQIHNTACIDDHNHISIHCTHIRQKLMLFLAEIVIPF